MAHLFSELVQRKESAEITFSSVLKSSLWFPMIVGDTVFNISAFLHFGVLVSALRPRPLFQDENEVPSLPNLTLDGVQTNVDQELELARQVHSISAFEVPSVSFWAISTPNDRY